MFTILIILFTFTVALDCPNGTIYESSADRCVPLCPDSDKLSYDGQCWSKHEYCKEWYNNISFMWADEYNGCKYGTTYCSNKIQYSSYNSVNNTCDCTTSNHRPILINDYYFESLDDWKPACVSIDEYCGTRHVTYSEEDGCVCDEGYLIVTQENTPHFGLYECVSPNKMCQRTNGVWDANRQACKCEAPYIQQPDAETGVCFHGDTYCLMDLGQDSEYDFSSFKCKCKEKYYLYLGKCMWGETYCNENILKYSKFDSVTQKCVCSPRYIAKVIKGVNQCVAESNDSQTLWMIWMVVLMVLIL